MYQKEVNGEMVYTNGNAIQIDGIWISNPTAEQMALAGWSPYVPPTETLEGIKNRKIADSDSYAESLKVVNLFGNAIWATPSERDNYLSTLQSAQRLGIDSVPFFGMNISVTQAITIIDTVNVWAMSVTAVKDAHMKAIQALETSEEVEAYDFTTGYPNPLVFNQE